MTLSTSKTAWGMMPASRLCRAEHRIISDRASAARHCRHHQNDARKAARKAEQRVARPNVGRQMRRRVRLFDFAAGDALDQPRRPSSEKTAGVKACDVGICGAHKKETGDLLAIDGIEGLRNIVAAVERV